MILALFVLVPAVTAVTVALWAHALTGAEIRVRLASLTAKVGRTNAAAAETTVAIGNAALRMRGFNEAWRSGNRR